jgi:hypothetical protein
MPGWGQSRRFAHIVSRGSFAPTTGSAMIDGAAAGQPPVGGRAFPMEGIWGEACFCDKDVFV